MFQKKLLKSMAEIKKENTPSGPIYKSPTAQIAHTKEWRLMEVESLNWSYFFSLFHFCPSYFYYYGPLPLSSLKEILVTRPTSFPGSRSFEPAPEPELGQSSCKNKQKPW